LASNYNPAATVDDGSCEVYGCMDISQWNYDCATSNPTTALKLANPFLYQFGCTDGVTHDDGSCVPIIYGCIDPSAFNYYSAANVNNGTCIYCTTLAPGTSIYSAATSSSIILEWVVPTNTPGYVITVQEVVGAGSLVLNTSFSTTAGNESYTIPNLNASTTYFISLVGNCGLQGAGSTETLTVTTLT